MNEVELDQVELAGLLKDSLGLSDTLSSRNYILDRVLGKSVTVGWCGYDDRPDVKYVFSMDLPCVYSVATNGDPEKIGAIVAWVSNYNINTKRLKYGDTCLIENRYLKSKGYVGCFVSPPAISDFYGAIENKIKVLDSDVSMCVLIFITNDDYNYCKNNGPKEFIGLLMDSEKSIIDF